MTDGTPEIRQLDERTVQRIAAGEVVERPASVVKELLENSLDAGATRLSVAVERGGKDGIRVSDDGHGIPQSELPQAVAEHATSKIQDLADLEAGVGSLGFRGEALSTIGAVSRLTVRSRPVGGGAGAELRVEGGEVGDVEPAGCPEGTTVEVEDLFFNTPARKKFLKRDSTEFDHINTVVSQYALANPDVAVSLSHNDRELFATEGSGSLRSAVLSVYGREVAESMIEIEAELGKESPVESISGLISHPETTRSTRAYLATFVNSRYVTASALRGAVVDGYGGQLAADRYPFAVLFVDVPPASVDVNVHPRKTEVRFDNEEEVLSLVSETVERTLVDSGLIRSSAPRGRSAPEETAVAPERTDDAAAGEAATMETETPTQSESATQTEPASDGSEPPETPDGTDRGPTTETTDPVSSAADEEPTDSKTVTAEPVDPADESSWTVDGLGGDSQESPEQTAASRTAGPPAESGTLAETASDSATDSDSGSDGEPIAKSAAAPAQSSTETPSPGSDDRERSPGRPEDQVSERQYSPAEPTTQKTLTGGETTQGRSYDRLPTLRVLGQLYDTYLLAETESGLILIDQHAADERVNYERLQRAVADSPSVQGLAEPVSLELTAREAALFDDHSDELAAVGFRAEQRETREIEVTAVPAVFSTTFDPGLLRDALLRFVESADGGEETVSETVDELLADFACYPSVTGNTSLTEGSVVELLSALDECENPYACPHGRPVIIEISREEIDDRFERDYPGHGGRRREE